MKLDPHQRLPDHLGIALHRVDGRLWGTLPLGAQSLTGHGVVSAGVVATLVDQLAGAVTSDAQRGRAVTSHLSLRLGSVPTNGVLEAVGRAAKASAASVVTLAEVRDEAGAQVATATVTFTVLRGDGGTHTAPADRPRLTGWVTGAETIHPVSTHDYLDMRTVGVDGDHHVAELDFADGLRNVLGVVHGGGVLLVVEHAALLAAAALGVERPAVDDLEVHFLSPANRGPFRTRTSVGVGAGGRATFVVELHDEGRDGRRVALGFASSAVDAPLPAPGLGPGRSAAT